MKHPKSQNGFVLVTVLIVAAVGLLFGAGALLLFRYQCQLRIDRQHELEKLYAVRSALNYIRGDTGNIDDSFTYHTDSGRDLRLIIKPAARIFPDLDKLFSDNPKKHFVMESGDNSGFPASGAVGQYNQFYDYEYGAPDATNTQMSVARYKEEWSLAFEDPTNAVTRWVNIGMRGTGGWLQEDYGRRYYFFLHDFVGNGNADVDKDIIRLCLIRNVTNEVDASGKVLSNGHRRGWPLSRKGERAIVMQVHPASGATVDNALMTVAEWVCEENGFVSKSNLLYETTFPTLAYMGMQVASNTVSLFYIDNSGNTSIKTPGYAFSKASAELSSKTCEYFGEGMFRDSFGKLQAPEMRAVFEVENPTGNREPGRCDYLTNFRVTPAYQYDVYLEYPPLVTNRATVAQRIGFYSGKNSSKYTILTYDTHGTENKGFRKDEREAERKRGIR